MLIAIVLLGFLQGGARSATDKHVSLTVLPILFSGANGPRFFSQGNAFQIDFTSSPVFVGTQFLGNISVLSSDEETEIRSIEYILAPYVGLEVYHRYDPFLSIGLGGRIYLNRAFVRAYEVFGEIRYARENFILLGLTEEDDNEIPLISLYGIRAGYVDFPDNPYPLWYIGVEGCAVFLDIPIPARISNADSVETDESPE